jgi:hypothetical protein
MDTTIKKKIEVFREQTDPQVIKIWNPDALDHTKDLRMKSIEFGDDYTRIDFIFRSSMVYINGGWIQMERNSFIRPTGSTTKYTLLRAIGIPIAPLKHYFKRKGEYYNYSMIFPALPMDTKTIDIIEKEAVGSYFNFYGVDYSKWMKIPHPMDVERSNN